MARGADVIMLTWSLLLTLYSNGSYGHDCASYEVFHIDVTFVYVTDFLSIYCFLSKSTVFSIIGLSLPQFHYYDNYVLDYTC